MSKPSRITKEQALEIRRRYSTKGFGGAGMAVLAQEYDLHLSTIHRILAGDHEHTRGLPSIAGTRGGGIYDRGGQGAFSGAPGATPRISKTAAAVRGPVSLRDQRMQATCPVCGAKSRERCVNPRRPFAGPISKLHDERGK